MDTLIKRTESWVIGIYKNADHLIRTAYWVEYLKPDADDALIIAALTHDIERAFTEGRKPPISELSGQKWDDSVYNKWHGKRSAKFVKEYLQKENIQKEIIDRTCSLIKKHEFGGENDADLLRDADSISFLELITPLFISWIPKKMNREAVKAKLDYMYFRISGKKAKAIAQKFYDKGIADLERI